MIFTSVLVSVSQKKKKPYLGFAFEKSSNSIIK